MMVRRDQPELSPAEARLNLLLSYGRWQRGSVMDQLPRLLTPMGIRSIRVTSGEGAARAINEIAIHMALVDLAMPLVPDYPTRAAGPRVLQLLRRLSEPPPTIVIRPPQPTARDSARGLAEALREGAFAVLDRPVDLETILEVMRCILRRHYADVWPAS
ncbi:MAG: hypothetical protein ACYS0G_06250 [Planctomycetota bacterium]|jgi:DNA-binding response OmpR family regulator